MEANLVLLLAAGVLVTAGVYLILDKVLTRILMGVVLLGNGANLLILQAGGAAGSPPIVGRDNEVAGPENADPLAQAMILTAIVISMALTAFILTLIYRQYRYRTADIVEQDAEDAAVATAARSNTSWSAPDHDASDDPETGRMTSEGDSFGPKSFESPVKGANDE
ncbi:Na(+)/H(+) antiporter subunit C [Corynebacterium yudongzhengii]|uniref:Na(+)/H(+) antiporter subunit C n=1 Tax=Corynebacterium yudongzhengii TaxID=2080740 RepID=A0A2U1T5Y2_9CORY|nr:Na(+)/H(+) antiporter subunit C [Corynebacterium yudongzhengii]AWB82661.1 Na(+)/H(+) antiporter subunit C [Corynebacterium yudongzhengii]PWC01373.1 Na(+)/H(+) antiporter subunit C [Corynebacterium yudongzhengii]